MYEPSQQSWTTSVSHSDQTELEQVEEQAAEEDKKDQPKSNSSRVADIVNNRLLPGLLGRLGRGGMMSGVQVVFLLLLA